MKQYLDVFWDFLCDNWEVIGMCSIPASLFAIVSVVVFFYGKYLEDDTIAALNRVRIFFIASYMVFSPLLLLKFMGR